MKILFTILICFFIKEELFSQVDIEYTYNSNAIYYNRGSSKLSIKSKALLDELYKLYSEHPNMICEFDSYADCRGSEKYNLKLTEKRSESIKNYLLFLGLEKNKMQFKNYGEKRLVNLCDCKSSFIRPLS